MFKRASYCECHKILDLLTEYSIISDKLTSAIENEKDISEMRNFLNELPSMITDPKKRHKILSDRIDRLENFLSMKPMNVLKCHGIFTNGLQKLKKLKIHALYE